jgi:hypothetical protein
MPAFQSVSEPELSKKYRLNAIGCERQAKHATDQATEQRWHELAAQWHSMASQAAKMAGWPPPGTNLTRSPGTGSNQFVISEQY